ncbi:MAG: daunorubicin resistance protein DrrA family transporter ATP-binding protein [Frankiales bacterium]|nr:daunorubicin resistance protein DrrA family transporter ATP-binding protein [Frankiales bacterium]
MTYTVIARGLSKSFGARTVLDQVDLEVSTGSVLALLGPNGAGKTTLVRILATLLRPDVGAATVAGRDLLTDPVGVKRSISLTGQYAAIDDVLTGQENLEMMARLRHLPRRAVGPRVRELLAEFNLADARDRRAGTYSGGMRRRLDLAVSMISHPQLMFLDEPTTGLDPRSRDQLWATVRRLVADGVTFLLTTQYLEEADQLADTIAVLDRGRVVARGTPEALKANLGAEVLRLQFADAASYQGALACLAAEPTPDRLRTLEVATDGSAAEVSAVLRRLDDAGVAASKVTSHRPSLDEVFLALTSAGPESKELVR